MISAKKFLEDDDSSLNVRLLYVDFILMALVYAYIRYIEWNLTDKKMIIVINYFGITIIYM